MIKSRMATRKPCLLTSLWTQSQECDLSDHLWKRRNLQQ
jgi:hypothetical protein